MINDKSREIVFDEGSLVPKIGYSIATVYSRDPKTKISVKLENLLYLPSDENFYYNDNIHLPRELVSYFEGRPISDDLVREIQEAGIYNKEYTDHLINEYQTARAKSEIGKRKILILGNKK